MCQAPPEKRLWSIELASLRSSWSCEMASFESDDESENIWKESLPILYVDCHGGFSSVEDSVTSLSTIERAEEGLQDSLRQSRLQRALAPGQILTQSDIQRLYHEQVLGPIAVPVIFILKLSLAMISFGQSAADTEDVVFQVCTAIELPVVHFEVGTRNIHASFGGIVHTVPFARGIRADKVASTISLANFGLLPKTTFTLFWRFNFGIPWHSQCAKHHLKRGFDANPDVQHKIHSKRPRLSCIRYFFIVSTNKFKVNMEKSNCTEFEDLRPFFAQRTTISELERTRGIRCLVFCQRKLSSKDH